MKKSNLKYILIGILVLITAFIYVGVCYLKKYYVVSFEMLIVTLFSNLEGTGSEVIEHAASYMIPRIIAIMLVYVLFVITFNSNKMKSIINLKIFNKEFKINGIKLLEITTIIISILLIVRSFLDLGVKEYLVRKNQVTTIYEEHFVDPNEVNIISDGDEKNIIYIYLESIESTYMFKEDGGSSEYELLPNLYNLANENINFSFTDKVGGFHNVYDTDWTIAALLASESGVPYSFPIDRNDMNADTAFAPNIVTLGDILAKNGYKQEFLCGSDARFGSRNAFFKTHGDYKIYDYYSALEDGYVNDYIYWGLEDRKLYEIAKDELTKLANSSEKFNFTLLTVDTHPSKGWFCGLCEDKYDEQYYNVLNCADRQVVDFINWIKEQDFYENTVIVVTGDHMTMESLHEFNDNADRYVYNCFINSMNQNTDNIKNRKFNILDMLPTVLSSMGFEIEGDKLALGTNLFSGVKTLEEEIGFEYINDELGKYSKYFAEHFY